MSAAPQGFVPPDSPLSPRAAFAGLAQPARALVSYPPRTLWEIDTASLPRPLRGYRRRVREFATRVLRPLALHADRDPGQAAEQVLAAAAREGHLSDLLPRPLGSANPLAYTRPFHLAASLKMEELCAACGGLGLVIGAHGLGVAPVLLSGDRRAITRHLLPILRENHRGHPHVMAYAITEPEGGSDVEDSHGASAHRPGTRARRTDGGWLVTGRKVFISGGDLARTVSVFAALDSEGMESWTCFLVDTAASGFLVARNEHKMGQRASSASELVLDGVFVPDDRVIGGLRRGWAINRAVLNYSRIPVGAIALGIARGAMEAAIAFARRHRVAGRPVLDHQEAQLAIAQMIIDTAAMRALVWHAASSWTARQSTASATKVFCADTAVRVCETAMELMGDAGLLHANRAEKAYRDARLTQIYEGTNEINRLAVIEDQMEELLAHR